MGITGLIPFLEKASRRANVGEFSGCTVAIDSYCWLHKGAFACADKLVRGEHTDIHIKYCLKYVTMLLSKNIKPILVFDGRHLPAKAMTESKRRESRDISKKRAAELLSLGKIEEARSYMRRSVDITHAMALGLIQECRKRNVDCIVAPYEADSQLAYLNIKNIAHLVITEDSDLILFGCTKVLFKMDLDGTGTLVETIKLPLVMRCPIEHYSFDKFRQMCIMSGCDYLPSLPGIGLAKARQFITATQDPNIANALKKLPSYFNRMSLTVTDEYRENFLKAEATFRHQYVYDPLDRRMVRLTDPDDDDVETALCVNAGELLEPKTAFQLALGNVDPFTLKVMDDWHPDDRPEQNENVKTESWKDQGVSNHSSIWSKEFRDYLSDPCPWQKKAKRVEPIIAVPQTRSRPKVVNLVARYVPETQDERAGSYLAQRLSIAIQRGNAASVLGSMPQNGDLDDVLSIETLSNMYSLEPVSKKPKTNCNSDETYTQVSQHNHNIALKDAEIVNHLPTSQDKSPILENKERSYKKCMKNGTNSLLKRMSKFPRTTLDENVVKSKFFNSTTDDDLKSDLKESDVITIEESPQKKSRNPFRVKSVVDINKELQLKYSQRDRNILEIDSQCSEIPDSQFGSQKENSPMKRRSPGFESNLKKNPRLDLENGYYNSEESVIENTYPLENLITPVDSQLSFGSSPPKPWGRQSQPLPSQGSQGSQPTVRKTTCRVPGLKRNSSLPSNQPTLLSKFGFQKKPVLKR